MSASMDLCVCSKDLQLVVLGIVKIQLLLVGRVVGNLARIEKPRSMLLAIPNSWPEFFEEGDRCVPRDGPMEDLIIGLGEVHFA